MLTLDPNRVNQPTDVTQPGSASAGPGKVEWRARFADGLPAAPSDVEYAQRALADHYDATFEARVDGGNWLTPREALERMGRFLDGFECCDAALLPGATHGDCDLCVGFAILSDLLGGDDG